MLEAGDTAPEFEAETQNGDTVALSDYRGKTVVLYFYPKDNTPGCTKEACSFRDAQTAFEQQDVVVLGVSADSASSHAAFADKHDLNFPLLADPDRAIITAYDVKGRTGHAKRVTYVINEEGVIDQVYTDVSVGTHANDVLGDL